MKEHMNIFFWSKGSKGKGRGYKKITFCEICRIFGPYILRSSKSQN